MDNYIDELINLGMGNVIDMSIDEYIVKDEVYAKNMEKAESIFKQMKQRLSVEERELLEQYEACIMSANERACTLAYLVATKNLIKFMKCL